MHCTVISLALACTIFTSHKPGLLKSALHSDGKFPTPVVGLQGHPKKTFGSSAITDTAAIAAVFPPVAKPPAFVTIVAKTTDAAATTAAAASVNPDEFKKQQRLEQNKMSARRSRRRKKIILEELQATVDHLTAENELLDAENQRLEKELERRKNLAIQMKDNADGGGLAIAAAPPSALGTGLSTSGGTDMSMATIGNSAVPAIVVPANSMANRSLLVSRLSTIMNGQAAPGLCARSQTLGKPTVTTGTLPNLDAASIISSIATPAPRPSQLYLSRPTLNADAKNTSSSSSSAATAQEQLQRSILSLYQEHERKDTNKKRRLRK